MRKRIIKIAKKNDQSTAAFRRLHQADSRARERSRLCVITNSVLPSVDAGKRRPFPQTTGLMAKSSRVLRNILLRKKFTGQERGKVREKYGKKGGMEMCKR